MKFFISTFVVLMVAGTTFADSKACLQSLVDTGWPVVLKSSQNPGRFSVRYAMPNMVTYYKQLNISRVEALALNGQGVCGVVVLENGKTLFFINRQCDSDSMGLIAENKATRELILEEATSEETVKIMVRESIHQIKITSESAMRRRSETSGAVIRAREFFPSNMRTVIMQCRGLDSGADFYLQHIEPLLF